MAKAIDILMSEHRAIENVLGSLETFVKKMESGVEDERATLRDYTIFFESFADECHHGKEEDILFQKMISKGFPAEYGPIAVMQEEHVEGRNHILLLSALAEGSKPLTQQERESVKHLANSYILLLRDHILKEDLVLYPMAYDALRESEMASLVAEFDDFESREMPPDRHETLHAIARHLIEAYPPAPWDDAAGPKGPSCCDHPSTACQTL